MEKKYVAAEKNRGGKPLVTSIPHNKKGKAQTMLYSKAKRPSHFLLRKVLLEPPHKEQSAKSQTEKNTTSFPPAQVDA